METKIEKINNKLLFIMIVNINDKIFVINTDLNCLFFKALLEEKIDEINLFLFQDIFVALFENKNLDSLLNTFEINYLYKGLTYFGSHFEQDLIHKLFNNILKFETDILKNPICEIFENNLPLINWTLCSSSTFLTEEFFIKHIDRVDWYTLSDNHVLSLKFYEKFENRVIWQNVGSNPNLSIEIIERHIDTINWDRISINKKLPLEFFEKYAKKINWLWLSSNPSLTQEFILKHTNQIDWKFIKSNKNVSLQFLENNLNRIGLENVVQNRNITFEFLEKHKNNFNFHCWAFVFKNPYTPLLFIQNNIEIIKKHDLWKYISMNPKIDIDFATRYIHKLDWNLLLSNPNITQDFFEKNKIQIKPYYFAKNPNLYVIDIPNYLVYTNIYSNTFNINKKIKNKIINTKYFEFEQLNKEIYKKLI